MSDNIPFDIQMEIIKKVSDIKSLIQFRSVSKQWKSFIDSSHFIKGYGACHTQPHSHILRYICHILRYISAYSWEDKYICLVENDIKTLRVQTQEFALSPLPKRYPDIDVVGVCQGLVCLLAYNRHTNNGMVVLWNPSIQKSVGISVQPLENFIGFGVCPVTRDPTVVQVLSNKPWHAEVFTLSSGVWNVIPSGNLPRQSIELTEFSHVVVERFIYWGACEITYDVGGRCIMNHMVVSFDLITKEFKVVDLPDTLTNELPLYASVSKLRGSLVVFGRNMVKEFTACGVWVMERDSSFRKLFSIGARVYDILGFRTDGQPIFQIRERDGQLDTLHVYDPNSQQIKNLGSSGQAASFSMGSYKESLLLLDHMDLHIYSDDRLSK